MTIQYDKYYQSRDLFGDPCPEVLAYFESQSEKGKVLDLGCGQGRDALPLARLGYQVTAIDHSIVGIGQMLEVSNNEGLGIEALVSDVYSFTEFGGYQFVLLDSMFHFNKKDRDKELQFLDRIFKGLDQGAKMILCIANTGLKVDIAKKLIEQSSLVALEDEVYYSYEFIDQESGHSSKTAYGMLVACRIQDSKFHD